jgi:hypothetical protein
VYIDFNGRRIDLNLTSRHAVAAVITALVVTVGVLGYLLWMPRERVATVPAPAVQSAVQAPSKCESFGGVLVDGICKPLSKVCMSGTYDATAKCCVGADYKCIGGTGRAVQDGPGHCQIAGDVWAPEIHACLPRQEQVQQSLSPDDAKLIELLKKKRGY